MNNDFIVKWYHGISPRYHWYIRGIRPDGSYYGEISRIEPCGKQIDIFGQLSEVDYIRLTALCDEIQNCLGNTQCNKVNEPWEGLVARGSVQEPSVIYRYRPRHGESSTAMAAFLRIIEILTPYLHDYELSLCGDFEVVKS